MKKTVGGEYSYLPLILSTQNDTQAGIAYMSAKEPSHFREED